MGDEQFTVKPVAEQKGIIESLKQAYYAPLVEKRISRGELAEAARMAVRSGREGLQRRVIDEVCRVTDEFMPLHEEAKRRDEEYTSDIDRRLNVAAERLRLAVNGIYTPPSDDTVWENEYLEKRERVVDARRALITVFEKGTGDIRNYSYSVRAYRVSVVHDNPFCAGTRVGSHALHDDGEKMILLV